MSTSSPGEEVKPAAVKYSLTPSAPSSWRQEDGLDAGESVVPMLTATELADAIDWTHGAIRRTSTAEPCLKDLEAHLRALLAVQRARAEAK